MKVLVEYTCLEGFNKQWRADKTKTDWGLFYGNEQKSVRFVSAVAAQLEMYDQKNTITLVSDCINPASAKGLGPNPH